MTVLSLWKGELEPHKPSMAAILAGVAERHHLTIEALVGPRKTYELAHARQEAMWEIRQRTSKSFTVIGRLFNRDHTTVMHACNAHEARLAKLTEGRDERSVRGSSNRD